MERNCRNRSSVALVAAALLLISPCLAWALDPVNKTLFGNTAVEGYDPVAYFTQGKPIEGKEEHSLTWNGAVWRFSDSRHLEMFRNDPERYAPQYGGYCAWAVSQNKTAGVDPRYWRIVEGKLYLNYSESVQKKWEREMKENIRKADRNWPGLLQR